MSDYYDLRREVARLVPRSLPLVRHGGDKQGIREKGRKKGYQEFKLPDGQWTNNQRLLKADEIGTFAEVSCRAAACPMPLNLDVYDSLKCPFGCKYCFPAGTKILMADGTEKVIERIRPGDRVMSFNPESLDIEPAGVVEKYKRQEDRLIELELEDGTMLRLTEEHPVFTRTGWVLAGNLTDQDEVLSWVLPFFGGGLQWKKIKRVRRLKLGKRNVYNFGVLPNNTYLANRVCVHNCYADSFKGTLYTAFFDNSRTVGVRHCNPDHYKRELDKLMKYRGCPLSSLPGGTAEKEEKRVARVTASGKKFSGRGGKSGWQAYKGSERAALIRAIATGIPMRLGIRFEDFTPVERKLGISLTLLRYLRDYGYPTMINTKSDLVGRDEYVEALSTNPGRAAVHVTLISSNNRLLKALEPGAPSYERRMWAMRQLAGAGVRVVARIEPFLVFLSDPPDEVERYMTDLWDAGVRHLTFDTYSWTAKNPGIRQSFFDLGLDWERLFLLGCDSQGLGSLLLGEFMKLWRERGFSCSTFDMGNVPDNDQAVCCEVGDWFQEGFNWGCTVMAARFIQSRGMTPTRWKDFDAWVRSKGDFLSEGLRSEVYQLWSFEGSNDAYSQGWSRGLQPAGADEDGVVWQYDNNSDFRKELLR